MKICPNCESMLPDHYKSCPKCGKELKLDYKIKVVAGGSKTEQKEVKNPLADINANEYSVHDFDDILESM